MEEKFVVFLKKTVSIRSVLGVLSTAKSTHHSPEEENSHENNSTDTPSLGLAEKSDLESKFDLPLLLSNFGKKRFGPNEVVQPFDTEVGFVSYLLKGFFRLFRFHDICVALLIKQCNLIRWMPCLCPVDGRRTIGALSDI